MRTRTPTPEEQQAARAAISGSTLIQAAASLGMSPTTLGRIARGMPATPVTLGRIAPKKRTQDEFAKAAPAARAPTRQRLTAGSWSIEAIRNARNAQMLGEFKLPVSLSAAMRTDDAIYTAYHGRLAPHAAIGTELIAASGARGEAVRRRAGALVTLPRAVLGTLLGDLAEHGVAVGHITRTALEDGQAVSYSCEAWPLEFVRWNAHLRTLETQTDGGIIVPITHGDGEWFVVAKYSDRPWMREAALIPGAMIWASHADGVIDWNAGSHSHGQAKIVGELAAGIPLLQDDGTSLSPDAEAFLGILQDIVSGDAGAALRPAGAKTDFLANGSTAWQVFKELLESRERAAARVYLGTDAALGALGGAPGVDIATLFGVASTKVQGDFEALEQSVNTGVYAPWCAENEGDSTYAPKLRYRMPDPDATRDGEEQGAASERLFADLERYRANGMLIDQDTVNKLAKRYGVVDVPMLAPATSRAVPIELTPSTMEKITSVDEARGSKGLPPLGDERGLLLISELEATAEAEAEAEASAEVTPSADPSGGA